MKAKTMIKKWRERSLFPYSVLYNSSTNSLSSIDGNLRTYSKIFFIITDRLCRFFLLFFSLSVFIVSGHRELVFHRAPIYSRSVHNCPRWKSHLLTNFVTCPQQFPRISSPFSFCSRPRVMSLKIECLFGFPQKIA